MVCRQIFYKVEQPKQSIKTAILKNGHNSNNTNASNRHMSKYGQGRCRECHEERGC